MMKRFGTAAFFAAWLAFVLAQLAPVQRLTADQARGHIGECFTVCGAVASAKYAETSAGSPTFLNLGPAFPQDGNVVEEVGPKGERSFRTLRVEAAMLTVVIWGSERFKFGTPEVDYRGKRVCATGTIREYQKGPQIVAIRRRQVALEERSLEGRFYDRLMDSITCFRGF